MGKGKVKGVGVVVRGVGRSIVVVEHLQTLVFANQVCIQRCLRLLVLDLIAMHLMILVLLSLVIVLVIFFISEMINQLIQAYDFVMLNVDFALATKASVNDRDSFSYFCHVEKSQGSK